MCCITTNLLSLYLSRVRIFCVCAPSEADDTKVKRRCDTAAVRPCRVLSHTVRFIQQTLPGVPNPRTCSFTVYMRPVSVVFVSTSFLIFFLFSPQIPHCLSLPICPPPLSLNHIFFLSSLPLNHPRFPFFSFFFFCSASK